MNFPMVYTTAYRWTGTGDVGEEQVAGNEPIRVSGPMVSGNFDPEHLFVATAEVCLANTFFFFASNSRLDVAAYRSSTEGTLEKAPEGGFRFKEDTSGHLRRTASNGAGRATPRKSAPLLSGRPVVVLPGAGRADILTDVNVRSIAKALECYCYRGGRHLAEKTSVTAAYTIAPRDRRPLRAADTGMVGSWRGLSHVGTTESPSLIWFDILFWPLLR